VAKQLDSTRKAMHRTREEISQLDARLADQHRVVVSARAEIVGDNGGVGERAMPATTSEDGEVGHALKLTERMSDDIGMLIGAARWLAKEAAQADEARAEARRLLGELNDARGEIHRLNKRVERERKGSKRLAAKLGEKTRAQDSLARLRDEVEAAGGHAAEVEAGRSVNERPATELDKKRQALDSLSRPKE
jgi:chromosome segregation ATPase